MPVGALIQKVESSVHIIYRVLCWFRLLRECQMNATYIYYAKRLSPTAPIMDLSSAGTRNCQATIFSHGKPDVEKGV